MTFNQWLGLGLFVAAGLFVISFSFVVIFGFLRLFRPKLINGKTQLPVEPVTFRNRQAMELKAWWYAGEANKPVIVFCHGVGGNRADLRRLFEPLGKMGYGIFVFDFRGHGESSGIKTTFGYTERWDLLAAVKFLKESGRLAQRPLALYGLSMGGAAVAFASRALMAVYPVSAVVIDSAFARFAPIVKMSVKHWPLWARLVFLSFAYVVAEKIFELPSMLINPIRWIRYYGSTRVLIIHSDADELVPIADAREMFDHVTGPKEFLELQGVEHGASYLSVNNIPNKIAGFIEAAPPAMARTALN